MNKLSIVRQQLPDDAQELRKARVDLEAAQASLSPKYFYDALGCRLFEAICLLPEYYPTRTEAAIFSAYENEIAHCIQSNKNFLDLGAGDCQKAGFWLARTQPQHYLALDIAESAIVPALESFTQQHPRLQCTAVVCDFTRGFDVNELLGALPTTVFYPGSSIGNFSPAEALQFLTRMAAHTHGGGLLIGVDMRKDSARLQAAYDDAVLVTAAFNLNGLRHLARLLGAQVSIRDFAHRASFNTDKSRIEMHLEALCDTQITFADGAVRRFARGERIHTENSYKYSVAEFADLLRQAGFQQHQCWQDQQGDFAVFYARV
ncbi:MAG: L-histidine N(alpha)-methyltransferase [Pseudomonadota bacterium]|jgi:dimethylhistidine N-methyltransferase